MIVIAGCTGDLSKKKLFPAINKVLRRKLQECMGGTYAEIELNQTEGTLSSSTSAHNMNKYSPITIANPEDPLERKLYIEATQSRILHNRIEQGEVLKNNKINIPRIVGYARTVLTREEFIRRIDPNVSYLKETVDSIDYYSGEYAMLLDRVKKIEEKQKAEDAADTYLYLAVPPEVYPAILQSIQEEKEREKKITVLIEKPIGTSLKTFRELKVYMGYKPEIFLCVDHYLFKNVIVKYADMFNRTILKELIAPGHISRVKGYFNEVIGVEGREGYYNTSGACRDVLQNHLLLSIATVLAGNGSRIEIIKKIDPLKPENTLFGVYKGYEKAVRNLKEKDSKDSKIDIKETFIKTETRIAHPWNIPLSMTAGKKMPYHFVGIIIILTDSSILKVIQREVQPLDYENKKLAKKIEKALTKEKEPSKSAAETHHKEIKVETEESHDDVPAPEKNTESAFRNKISGKVKIKITPKESITVEIRHKNRLAKKICIDIPSTGDNIDAYEHLFNQLIFTKNLSGFSPIEEIEEQWKIVDPILDSQSVKRKVY